MGIGNLPDASLISRTGEKFPSGWGMHAFTRVYTIVATALPTLGQPIGYQRPLVNANGWRASAI